MTARKGFQKCTVEGCDRKLIARGLCGLHYRQAHERGEFNFKICSVEACGKTALAHGYCRHHYNRVKRYGTTERPVTKLNTCKVEGCGKKHYGGGLCEIHYSRLRSKFHGRIAPFEDRQSIECCVPGCDNLKTVRGLCHMHYNRLFQGDKTIGPPKPKRKPKGSGYITPDGYKIVVCRGHQNAFKSGKIFEHMLVMSEVLGRPLRKGELVHHENGIRNDNAPDNLELWTKGHPAGQRVTDRIASAISLLREYASDAILWSGDQEGVRKFFIDSVAHGSDVPVA